MLKEKIIKTVAKLVLIFFVYTFILYEPLLGVSELVKNEKTNIKSEEEMTKRTELEFESKKDTIENEKIEVGIKEEKYNPKLQNLDSKLTKNLPYKFGRIVDGKYKSSDCLIIFVQDLHCHPEVQRNIYEIIKFFDENYNLDKVFVEGIPSGKADLQVLSSIPNSVKKEVLDNLLSKGMISAAEYYSAIVENNKLYGIEDWDLYYKNFERANFILSNKDVWSKWLLNIERKISFLKNNYLTSEPKSIVKFLDNAKSQSGQFTKYYLELEKISRKYNISLFNYPNLRNYFTLIKIDRDIDHNRLVKDIERFFRDLQYVIPIDLYTQLTEQLKDETKIEEYYFSLLKISKEYNIDLKKYSALKNFFTFVELNYQINPINLVLEEKLFLKEILNFSTKNVFDREILFIDEMFSYLKNYLELKITYDEFMFFRDNIAQFKLLLKKYFGESTDEVISFLNRPEIFKFYNVNIDRDKIFYENIVKNLLHYQNTNVSTTKLLSSKIYENFNYVVDKLPEFKSVNIIVAGGFHLGINKMLLNCGFSTLTIVPNATTKSDDTIYEKLLTQKFNILDMLKSSFAPVVIDFLVSEKILKKSESVPLLEGLVSIICSVAMQKGISVSEMEKEIKSWLTNNGLDKVIDIEFVNENSFNVVVKRNEIEEKFRFKLENGKIIFLNEKKELTEEQKTDKRNKEVQMVLKSPITETIFEYIIPFLKNQLSLFLGLGFVLNWLKVGTIPFVFSTAITVNPVLVGVVILFSNIFVYYKFFLGKNINFKDYVKNMTVSSFKNPIFFVGIFASLGVLTVLSISITVPTLIGVIVGIFVVMSFVRKHNITFRSWQEKVKKEGFWNSQTWFIILSVLMVVPLVTFSPLLLPTVFNLVTTGSFIGVYLLMGVIELPTMIIEIGKLYEKIRSMSSSEEKIKFLQSMNVQMILWRFLGFIVLVAISFFTPINFSVLINFFTSQGVYLLLAKMFGSIVAIHMLYNFLYIKNWLPKGWIPASIPEIDSKKDKDLNKSSIGKLEDLIRKVDEKSVESLDREIAENIELKEFMSLGDSNNENSILFYIKPSFKQYLGLFFSSPIFAAVIALIAFLPNMSDFIILGSFLSIGIAISYISFLLLGIIPSFHTIFSGLLRNIFLFVLNLVHKIIKLNYFTSLINKIKDIEEQEKNLAINRSQEALEELRQEVLKDLDSPDKKIRQIAKEVLYILDYVKGFHLVATLKLFRGGGATSDDMDNVANLYRGTIAMSTSIAFGNKRILKALIYRRALLLYLGSLENGYNRKEIVDNLYTRQLKTNLYVRHSRYLGNFMLGYFIADQLIGGFVLPITTYIKKKKGLATIEEAEKGLEKFIEEKGFVPQMNELIEYVGLNYNFSQSDAEMIVKEFLLKGLDKENQFTPIDKPASIFENVMKNKIFGAESKFYNIYTAILASIWESLVFQIGGTLVLNKFFTPILASVGMVNPVISGILSVLMISGIFVLSHQDFSRKIVDWITGAKKIGLDSGEKKFLGATFLFSLPILILISFQIFNPLAIVLASLVTIVLHSLYNTAVIKGLLGKDSKLASIISSTKIKKYESLEESYKDLPGRIKRLLENYGFSREEIENAIKLIDLIRTKYEEIGLSTQYYHNHLHTLVVTHNALLLASQGRYKEIIKNKTDIKILFLSALLHDFHIREAGIPAKVDETIRQLRDILGLQLTIGPPTETKYKDIIDEKFKNDIKNFVQKFLGDEVDLVETFKEIEAIIRRTDFPFEGNEENISKYKISLNKIDVNRQMIIDKLGVMLAKGADQSGNYWFFSDELVKQIVKELALEFKLPQEKLDGFLVKNYETFFAPVLLSDSVLDVLYNLPIEYFYNFRDVMHRFATMGGLEKDWEERFVRIMIENANSKVNSGEAVGVSLDNPENFVDMIEYLLVHRHDLPLKKLNKLVEEVNTKQNNQNFYEYINLMNRLLFIRKILLGNNLLNYIDDENLYSKIIMLPLDIPSIDSLSEKNEELRDILDKLNSRDVIENVIKSGFETGKYGSMVFIDVNWLRLKNNIIGKTGMNVVLDKFYDILFEVVKSKGGYVWRQGGDEFVLVFPKDIPKENVIEISNGIIEGLQKIKFQAVSLGSEVEKLSEVDNKVKGVGGRVYKHGENYLMILPKNVNINDFLDSINKSLGTKLIIVKSHIDKIGNEIDLSVSIGVAFGSRYNNVLRQSGYRKDVAKQEFKRSGRSIVVSTGFENLHGKSIYNIESVNRYLSPSAISYRIKNKNVYTEEREFRSNILNNTSSSRAIIFTTSFFGYKDDTGLIDRFIDEKRLERDERINNSELKVINDVFGYDIGDEVLKVIRTGAYRKIKFKNCRVIFLRGPPAGPLGIVIPEKGVILSEEEISKIFKEAIEQIKLGLSIKNNQTQQNINIELENISVFWGWIEPGENLNNILNTLYRERNLNSGARGRKVFKVRDNNLVEREWSSYEQKMAQEAVETYQDLLSRQHKTGTETISVPRPVRGNVIDRTKAQNWVEEFARQIPKKIRQKYKDFAQLIVDNITHISQEQFEEQLQKSVKEFNIAIGDKPYVVVFFNKKDEPKSNEWVYYLSLEKGLRPAKKIVYVSSASELQGRKFYDEDGNEITDILYIDDAAYTGGQVSGNVYRGFSGGRQTVHIVIPFMTKQSVDRINDLTKSRKGIPGINVQIYDHKMIETVAEIIKRTRKSQNLSEEVISELSNYVNISETESGTLTYFDHKLPDYVSFLSFRGKTLLESPFIVIDKNGFIDLVISGEPFVTKIESPYKTEEFLRYREFMESQAGKQLVLPKENEQSPKKKSKGKKQSIVTVSQSLLPKPIKSAKKVAMSLIEPTTWIVENLPALKDKLMFYLQPLDGGKSLTEVSYYKELGVNVVPVKILSNREELQNIILNSELEVISSERVVDVLISGKNYEVSINVLKDLSGKVLAVYYIPAIDGLLEMTEEERLVFKQMLLGRTTLIFSELLFVPAIRDEIGLMQPVGIIGSADELLFSQVDAVDDELKNNTMLKRLVYVVDTFLKGRYVSKEFLVKLGVDNILKKYKLDEVEDKIDISRLGLILSDLVYPEYYTKVTDYTEILDTLKEQLTIFDQLYASKLGVYGDAYYEEPKEGFSTNRTNIAVTLTVDKGFGKLETKLKDIINKLISQGAGVVVVASELKNEVLQIKEKNILSRIILETDYSDTKNIFSLLRNGLSGVKLVGVNKMEEIAKFITEVRNVRNDTMIVIETDNWEQAKELVDKYDVYVQLTNFDFTTSFITEKYKDRIFLNISDDFVTKGIGEEELIKLLKTGVKFINFTVSNIDRISSNDFNNIFVLVSFVKNVADKTFRKTVDSSYDDGYKYGKKFAQKIKNNEYVSNILQQTSLGNNSLSRIGEVLYKYRTSKNSGFKSEDLRNLSSLIKSLINDLELSINTRRIEFASEEEIVFVISEYVGLLQGLAEESLFKEWLDKNQRKETDLIKFEMLDVFKKLLVLSASNIKDESTIFNIYLLRKENFLKWVDELKVKQYNDGRLRPADVLSEIDRVKESNRKYSEVIVYVESLINNYVYEINRGVLSESYSKDNFEFVEEEISSSDSIVGMIFVFDFLIDRYRGIVVDASNITNISIDAMMQMMGAS